MLYFIAAVVVIQLAILVYIVLRQTRSKPFIVPLTQLQDGSYVFEPRVISLTINSPAAGAQLNGGLNTVSVSIGGLGDQERVAVDGGGPFALFCQAADVPSGDTVPVISPDITALNLEGGNYISYSVPAHTGDDRLIVWFYLQTPRGKTVRSIQPVAGGGN